MSEPEAKRAHLPDGDAVAASMGQTWEALSSVLTIGWVRAANGTYAAFSGLPVPSLNNVLAIGGELDTAFAQTNLDAIAAEGVPYSFEVRPALAQAGAEIAESRGMRAQADVPLMVTATCPASPAIDGLALRVLEPHESNLHCQVAGPAFGATSDLFEQLVPSEVLKLSQVRVYVGEVDQQAVVTAMSVRSGGSVGIFNVGTHHGHRRRGYGAAITARVIRDAMADGIQWAWLQSSPDGYALYEGLGFETIERWPCWVSLGDEQATAAITEEPGSSD